MALYKDGKVYRTLEQQVGYLSEKQNEQEVINEEVSQDIDDLEATVAVLPTKEYVDNADGALQNQINGKTAKGEEIIVLEISTTSGTLSDDDFNLLSLNNVIIKYSSYYLVKILSTTTYYRFAGLISSGSRFYLFEIDKSTKAYTITYSKIKVDADGVLNDYSAEIIGKILTVKSDYSSGWEVNSPEGNNIKSTSETSGKVLTTNGNGGASWQTPSGSGPDVITITSQTGNFSASDIVKLQKENTRLIYNNIVYTNAVNNGITLYYKGTYFGNGYVRYESVFVITISNGYYTRKTAPLTSDTATPGQVLTADGYGSSSWQTPTGGGGGHTLTFTKASGSGNLVLYYNDGTSESITNSETRNNVVAFTSNFAMSSLESGFSLRTNFDITQGPLYSGEINIPLTDVSVKAMSGGG